MKKKDTLDAVLKRVITEEYKKIISEQPQAAPLPKTPLSQINTKSNPAEIKKQQIAKIIAKKIYNSKGILYDKEFDAVKAIKEIPDVSTFNYVQQELQKLTGGRGIGQYLISFITVGGRSRSQTSSLTKQYLNQIITHLQKIGAPYKTIGILSNYLNRDFDAEQNETWHTVNLVLQIAGSVVATVVAGPAAGAAVAAAIGAADAKQYWDEGEPEMAGLMMFLSAVPGAAMLGKGGVKALVRKIVAKEALKESEKRFLTQALAKRAAAKQALQRKVAEGLTSGLVKPWMVKGTQFGAGWLKYATIPTLGYKQFLEPKIRSAYESLEGYVTADQMQQLENEMYRISEQEDAKRLRKLQSKLGESVIKEWKPESDDTSGAEDATVSDEESSGAPSWKTLKTIGYIILFFYLHGKAKRSFPKAFEKIGDYRKRGWRWLVKQGKRLTSKEAAITIGQSAQDLGTIKQYAIEQVRNGSMTAAEAEAWTRTKCVEAGLNSSQAVTKTFSEELKAYEKLRRKPIGFQYSKEIELTPGKKITLKNMTPDQIEIIRNKSLSINQKLWLQQNPDATYSQFMRI